MRSPERGPCSGAEDATTAAGPNHRDPPGPNDFMPDNYDILAAKQAFLTAQSTAAQRLRRAGSEQREADEQRPEDA